MKNHNISIAVLKLTISVSNKLNLKLICIYFFLPRIWIICTKGNYSKISIELLGSRNFMKQIGKKKFFSFQEPKNLDRIFILWNATSAVQFYCTCFIIIPAWVLHNKIVIWSVLTEGMRNLVRGSQRNSTCHLASIPFVFIVCSCHPWGLPLLLFSMENCGLGFVCYQIPNLQDCKLGIW